MSVRRGSTIIAGLPIIDGSLNTTSINPIQNQAVANAVNDLNGRIDAIIGGDVYTKDEVDDLLDDKADKATTLSGYNISDGANTDASNITNTGKLNILAMVMPDYSRGSDLTVNTEYTATQYGWVVWRCDNVQQGTLTINGTSFGGAGGIANQWADYNSMIAPVSPGDKYKATGRSLYRFYPCKGN